MVAIPSDYTIIGTVLAIAIAILLLSGLALYVAFRVRETLRDEKGRGARAAKVAFLIGLLFLSGGVFYFFASGFNAQTGTTTSATTSSTSSILVSSTTSSTATGTQTGSMTTTSSTATSTLSTTTTTSATTSTSTTQSSTSAVSMPTPQCPGQVTTSQVFQCTIYIYNTGSTTQTSATIVASGTFYDFTFVSCSESVNGGTPTSLSVSAHTITVGDIAPGTTVLTLTVQAPSQAGQYNNNVVTLSAVGLSQPISDTFTIQVTH